MAIAHKIDTSMLPFGFRIETRTVQVLVASIPFNRTRGFSAALKMAQEAVDGWKANTEGGGLPDVLVRPNPGNLGEILLTVEVPPTGFLEVASHAAAVWHLVRDEIS